MKKEIKHHIFTASLYQHNNGIYEYNIDNVDVYIQRNSIVLNQARMNPFDLPHLFELINICLKELNNDTNI